MWRHLKGAQLEKAQPSATALGRIQLINAKLGSVRISRHVNQQVAEHTVHQPRQALPMVRNLLEGNL